MFRKFYIAFVFRTDIFRKLSLGAPVNSTITSTNFSAILILGSCLVVSRLHSNDAGVPGHLPNLLIFFFFQVFFFSIRPINPISGNAFDTKRKKNGGGGGGMAWNGKKGSAFKNIRIRVEGASRSILITRSSPESICIPIWRAKTLRRGFT